MFSLSNEDSRRLSSHIYQRDLAWLLSKCELITVIPTIFLFEKFIVSIETLVKGLRSKVERKSHCKHVLSLSLSSYRLHSCLFSLYPLPIEWPARRTTTLHLFLVDKYNCATSADDIIIIYFRSLISSLKKFAVLLIGCTNHCQDFYCFHIIIIIIIIEIISKEAHI